MEGRKQNTKRKLLLVEKGNKTCKRKLFGTSSKLDGGSSGKGTRHKTEDTGMYSHEMHLDTVITVFDPKPSPPFFVKTVFDPKPPPFWWPRFRV